MKMSIHLCHAKCCPHPVPPKMLMCLPHWRMVPKAEQQAVWATYQPGQESGRVRPTSAYLDAAEAAIQVVYLTECAQGIHKAHERCRRLAPTEIAEKEGQLGFDSLKKRMASK